MSGFKCPIQAYVWTVGPRYKISAHGPSIGRDGALPKNDCRVKTHGPPAVGKNVYARGTGDAALKAV